MSEVGTHVTVYVSLRVKADVCMHAYVRTRAEVVFPAALQSLGGGGDDTWARLVPQLLPPSHSLARVMHACRG